MAIGSRCADAFAGATITMRSGVAAIGAADPELHVLAGPANSGFGRPLTTADFLAARNGPAPIVVDANDFWIAALDEDPAARWVNDTGNRGSGGSFLCAISFEVPSDIAVAAFDLHFAVDNLLGESAVPGIYVNEIPLPNSNGVGDHNVAAHYHRDDIADLLHTGTNTLYLYAHDYSGPGGLLFCATLTMSTIAPPSPIVCIETVVPLVMRADEDNRMSITVRNCSDHDLGDLPVNLAFPAGYEVAPVTLFDTEGGTAPGQGPGGAGWEFPAGVSPDDISFVIPTLPRGTEQTFLFMMPKYRNAPTGADFTTSVRVGPAWVVDNQVAIDCVIEAIDIVSDSFIETSVPCAGPLIVRGKDLILGRLLQIQREGKPWDESKFDETFFDFLMGCIPGEAIPAYIERFHRNMERMGTLVSILDCLDFPWPKVGLHSMLVSAFDPNTILGEVGRGPQHAILGVAPVRYLIECQNLPAATAPARTVVIRDTLDRDVFDTASVEFQTITLGSRGVLVARGATNVDTVVDLRPGMNLLVQIHGGLNRDRGELVWTFTSIDPSTGVPPTDPLAGFLPPDRTPPEGEVTVSFAARFLSAVSSGAVVENHAAIVFDHNDPILTPSWRNVVDRDPPDSRILQLIPTPITDVWRVRIDARDGGSGIEDVAILVSRDGGRYAPIFPEIRDGESTLRLVANHEYRLLSIGIDSLGNVEASRPERAVEVRVPPLRLEIGPAWPNPSAGEVSVPLVIEASSPAHVAVYDLQGRELARPFAGWVPAGSQVIRWDGRTAAGTPVGSGIYMLKLTTPNGSRSTKTVIIR